MAFDNLFENASEVYVRVELAVEEQLILSIIQNLFKIFSFEDF
jgi:hypothetical protein